MDYPKGRECGESDCMWLAPKQGAPRACLMITDYECTGKEKEWSDCPRARRARSARLAKAVAVCEKLVAWDKSGGSAGEEDAYAIAETCSLAREVVNG